TVLVTTEIDNHSRLLKPEMTGQAKIFCGRRRGPELFMRRLARTFKVEVWGWWGPGNTDDTVRSMIASPETPQTGAGASLEPSASPHTSQVDAAQPAVGEDPDLIRPQTRKDHPA